MDSKKAKDDFMEGYCERNHIHIPVRKETMDKIRRKVIVTDTATGYDERFNSVLAASYFLELSSGYLSRAIKNNRLIKSRFTARYQ